MIRSKDNQYGWSWIDPLEGDDGIMDDFGDFVPDWKLESYGFLYLYLDPALESYGFFER
jgi:hypothetical protein